MKRILLASLLCAVLLSAVLLSCPPAAQAGAAQPRLTPTKETENDNLRCYPLDAADCRFFTFRSDLLVLRPKAEGRTAALRREGAHHFRPGGGTGGIGAGFRRADNLLL